MSGWTMDTWKMARAKYGNAHDPDGRGIAPIEREGDIDYLTRAQDWHDDNPSSIEGRMDHFYDDIDWMRYTTVSRGISPAAVVAPGAESPHSRPPTCERCGKRWPCPEWHIWPHQPEDPPSEESATAEDLNDLDLWAERDYQDHMELASR